MDRRQFAKLVAAMAASSVPLAARPAEPAARPEGKRALLKPPALKPGAVVGLISPGGVVDDALIQDCVRKLELLGFTVKPGANLRAKRGGYAGTVEQRVSDLHAMFRDREVGAIWAARGGSGCAALLPHLDYGLMRRRPKILIGFSDITALHLAIYRHARIVTFHGPVASSTFSDFTVRHLRAVLMEPQRTYTMPLAEENLKRAAENPLFEPFTVRKGVAQGRLVGGNLSLVCAMIGTPYAAPIKGHLMFLEEVGEEPYRIDRMLTQLEQGGLAQAAGVVLGVFRKCVVAAGDASLSLQEVVEDRLSGLRIPAAYGYSFGHIAEQYPLPVGLKARLDTEARTITLLERAVTPY